MTRPLGSFNRRLKLDRRPEDRQRRASEVVADRTEATLGYAMGINRDYREREESTRTNAEKFVSGRRVAPSFSTGMRMAGVELRNQLQ